MNRTISYLRADMDRAKNHGERSLDVSILDLEEVLKLAESVEYLDKMARAGKHAGWAKPGSISMLNGGKKKYTRISRRRSDEFNTEVFYADDLRERQREVDAALIRLEVSQSAIDAAEQELAE